MTVAFQTESFSQAWPDAGPLLMRHWDEVSAKEITGPLDVDEKLYRQMDSAGLLHITTARAGHELVGYAAYLIYRNHHYRQKLIADADVFFLAPEYRCGLCGLRLLKSAEAALIERGVTTIVQKVKVAHDCGALFRRMGYTHVENVWMRAV